MFARALAMLAVLTPLCSCQALQQRRERAIPEGEFARFHSVRWYGVSDPPIQDAFDRLVLRRRGRDALWFTLELMADQGHTCYMEGLAQRETQDYVYREPVDYQNPEVENETCELRISRGSEDVLIDDVGGRCRIMNCGVRGSIGRTAFPLHR